MTERSAELAALADRWDATVLTFDIDWAPDFVIDWLAGQLVERGLRATWFVTHSSAAVDRLREHPELFELGIHPNFIQPSSHGADATAIIDACVAIVPEALAMRTHSLFQSTRHFADVLERTGIRVDASLYLPRLPVIVPVELAWRGRVLLRLPFFWEDDLRMEEADCAWDIAAEPPAPLGLKIYDFHPTHLYLNSPSMAAYLELKRRAPSLRDASPHNFDPLIWGGRGARTLFDGVVGLVERAGGGTTLGELHARWDKARGAA